MKRAQEAVATTAAEVIKAKATCARLADAIEAEKREGAAAVKASAAAMLEAARTGADAGTVAVRPDKLAPLQTALAGAEAERDRISTQFAADNAAVAAAQRRVREAKADASEVEYRSAEAAFVALAAQHVAALFRVKRDAPALNLFERVLTAARALETAP